MKVVWICQFTNLDVQSRLPIRKPVIEFGQWVPNMIREIENCSGIELHVISIHSHLKKHVSYTKNGVHYYFIPYGMPLIHRPWHHLFPFDTFTNFYTIRKRVRKVVEAVSPDLINLIGAEIPHYSSSILDYIGKYPVLIAIQGFVGEIRDLLKPTPYNKKRVVIEDRILRDFHYYAGEKDSSTYIMNFNPKHKFFEMLFPINEEMIKQTSPRGESYDCVFFGRLDRFEGIEEYLKVVSEMKKTLPALKACVVGSGDISSLKELAKQLGCLENLTFIGFRPSQKELFEIVMSAKLYLTTPFFERISLRIRECMFMRIPIVAYATGGIPNINKTEENVALVPTGDFQGMAKKAVYLLKNNEARLALAERAYHYAQKEYSGKANLERLINAYDEILHEI